MARIFCVVPQLASFVDRVGQQHVSVQASNIRAGVTLPAQEVIKGHCSAQQLNIKYTLAESNFPALNAHTIFSRNSNRHEVSVQNPLFLEHPIFYPRFKFVRISSEHMQVGVGDSLRADWSRLTLAATGREGENEDTAAITPNSMAQRITLIPTRQMCCTDGQSGGCSVDIGFTGQFDQFVDSCSALL